ncbi:MAG: hypothetical protein AAFU54_26210 [Chloroflexota bacterium]
MFYRVTNIAFVLLLLILIPQISAQTLTQETTCGDIIEGQLTENFEIQDYRISLSAGDSLFVEATTLGNQVAILILDPANNLRNGDATGPEDGRELSQNPQVRVAQIFGDGDYTIRIGNSHFSNTGAFHTNARGGVGVYTLFIGCTLRDGTVINPGPVDPTDTPSVPPAPIGIVFPDLAGIDRSSVIELPLDVPTPIAGESFVIYSYEASAGTSATLRLSRLSGNVSYGVIVANSDTNEIIFLGGMPSSNNLSVELTFPTDGTYAIGLFRLDTAERTGTSGAVQVVIE